MLKQTNHPVEEHLNQYVRLMEGIVWVLFVVSLLAAVLPRTFNRFLGLNPWLEIDGLARVMWPYVTLLGGILLSFSKRYMAGNHRIGRFFLGCIMFLLSVMVLSATDHLLVFLLAWLSMGWCMAGLIGHKVDWPQAKAAGRLALQYFLAGTVLLGVGIFVLYQVTGSFRISSLLGSVGKFTTAQFYAVIACFLVATLIQSALFPFQDWLMSSMTAPTPASALMHAGFVNAGGILMTKFSPLFLERSTPMLIITVLGAVSALMGKFWKLVQTAIKRQLGCSTIAQMGFMILQCGLGYFSAAISHLILHGFYKGYLFLSSGNAIQRTAPDDEQNKASALLRNLVSFVTGVIGVGIFIGLTGKGSTFNSGVFLVFIVMVTVLHSTREMLSQVSLSETIKNVMFPPVALGATVLYSVIFNGITSLLQDQIPVVSPTPFTWVHGLLVACFGVAWALVEFRVYEKFDRLYVYILNASQPHPATVLSTKEEYHV